MLIVPFQQLRRVLAVLVALAAGSIGVIGLPAGAVAAAPMGPYVAAAARPGGDGWWVVAPDGRVAVGGSLSPRTYGSMQGRTLNHPVVGIAGTSSGRGYWLVASDGGVFGFGDARFYGSTGALQLRRPIVGIARTRSGDGYWLAASDGGVFAFGDARFLGSVAGKSISAPIVAITRTARGRGYYLLGADGAVYAFGDARWYGATVTHGVPARAIALGSSGYWIADRDGHVAPRGAVRDRGNLGGGFAADDVIGIVPSSDGGYFLVYATGRGDSWTRFARIRAGHRRQLPAPPPAPPASSDYRIWHIAANGRPIRWDPCRTIAVYVNPAGQGGGRAELTAALMQLSAATGLRFAEAGTTSATGYIPGAIVVRWAALGSVHGQGGSEVTASAQVSGNLVLNDQELLPGGFSNRSWGAVILHELGHVVGLAHAPAPGAIMFPQMIAGGAGGAYRAGDLSGLYRLGSAAGCI